MKILKIVLIVLSSLAAILVIAGLFTTSKFESERSLVIDAPQEELFNQIKDLKNWNHWNAWNQIDTNWQVTYSEATSGVGASYAWVSQNENVGKGKVTITKSEPMQLVEGTMEFDGMEPALLYNKLEPQEGGVKVTFGIKSDVGNNIFMKLAFKFFGDKMVGGNYEKSLQNLKEYVKNHPTPPAAQPVPVENDSLTTTDGTAVVQ